MKPEFHNTFSLGKEGGSQDADILGVIVLDYKGWMWGVKNLGKSDYIVSEHSLTMQSVDFLSN